MADSALPLAEIRVLDLTAARSGPTAVRQLADWGADVVRIEPVGGDVLSSALGSGRLDSDFQNLHRNKRCINLNLASDAGRDLFYRLAQHADVIVENFRPGVKHRLGIDYETIAGKNPRIVYGSISGFGQTGPYAERPGFDQVIQGMSGLMSVTGLPGQGPVRAGIAVSDTAAGNFLAQGILLALFERERSGRGQWVQTSLLESLLAFMDFQAARWLMEADVPGQAGNDHPRAVPMGVFPASDGLVNIASGSEKMFRSLCKVLEVEQLADDPAYADPALRIENRGALNQAISEATLRLTRDELVERINAAGVPCGPIYDVREALEDPQVAGQGIAWPFEHPEKGSVHLVGQPVQLSRTPHQRVRRVPPASGEHTDEVLTELGLDAAEIASLRSSGVV